MSSAELELRLPELNLPPLQVPTSKSTTQILQYNTDTIIVYSCRFGNGVPSHHLEVLGV
jgi:hypothetical protein